MQRKKFNYKYGFTLAEVLITLGIIGVVAAITIPTLMKNTQDAEFKTAWKKAFSELSQANQQIITDNGGQDFSGQCSDYNNTCLKDLFATKLKFVKQCTNANTEGCSPINAKFMDGANTHIVDINSAYPALVTASGYSIRFRAHDSACTLAFPYECGWMQVDVNGLKSPNIAGRDIFFLGVAKTKLAPFGVVGDPNYPNPNTDCATGGTGTACSAVYLQQ